jgi:hypothetical protein
MKKHTHRAVAELTRERCFMGPITNPVGGENRAAHGNITITESCRCGMERRINVNGRHVERGHWVNDIYKPAR